MSALRRLDAQCDLVPAVLRVHHPAVGVRRQARRANGRYTRNTMENTLGLHVTVHGRKADGTWCGALNPSKVGEPRPTTCSQCGELLQGREEA